MWHSCRCVSRFSALVLLSSDRRLKKLHDSLPLIRHSILCINTGSCALTAQMNDLVRLGPHPTARNAAVAKSLIEAGSTVVSVSALSTCLLPSEKGRRCDGCHILESEEVKLRRCTGCASSWYCGTTCARRHPSAGPMRLHSVQARSEQGVEVPS